MKKIILLSFALIGFGTFAQKDPTVMTINGEPITKSEFLQIYLKNNNDPKYDKASIDEYLELFKKFKLKVAEAEALGYDTIPKLVKELDGYKNQLAQPYLIDSSKNEALIQEAYNRIKEEVRASHILIRTDAKANPADTLKAYNKILALKKRIEKGENFGEVAKMESEDPSAKQNRGDLGYFSAFQMVFPFEEAAFTTPVGKISDPIRTRFGYHLIYVQDKRPATGTIQAAHIMIAAKKGNASKGKEAKNRIDEIYDLLKKGEDFDVLAAKYSEDPSSAKKGGKLPSFGTGSNTRMVPEFTEAAFSLKNDGDFSKPIQTDYGWHIIKRHAWQPVASFDKMKKQLTAKVAKDVRAQQSQVSFIEKLKKEYKYKKKSPKRLEWFYENLDSAFLKGDFKASSIPTNKILFKMKKQKFRQQDFAEFLDKNRRKVNLSDFSKMTNKHYSNWENKEIIDYEKARLMDKYPAYKALMSEYHDGILLYEIMSDEVWNKAITDTIGLKAFHEKNKEKYRWGTRYEAVVFECNSEKIAQKANKLMLVDTLTASTVNRMLNEESALNSKYSRKKFSVEKFDYLKNAPIQLKKGDNPVFEYNDKFYFVRILEIIPPGRKDFNEAKGAVTSDYQAHLEEEWLKKLNKKHSIVINEEEIYNLNK